MQDINARREKLIRILLLNGRCTIRYLANRLGVSERTVMRDVYILSETKPISIDPGRAGGVYISNYSGIVRVRLSDGETGVLEKVVLETEQHGSCALNDSELHTIKEIIRLYSNKK